MNLTEKSFNSGNGIENFQFFFHIRSVSPAVSRKKISEVPFAHTLFWVGAEGGVYFFWASGGGLRVGTGFDTEGGYRGGTVSKKKISKWP